MEAHRHPPQLLVLVGIPGSGKTTYAQQLAARCPTARLVSPDLIRERLYPGYAEGRIDVRKINDQHVFRLAYHEAGSALATGYHVIFDATSLTIKRRHKLIALAHRHHAAAVARFFPVRMPEALRRNRLRTRQVPPGAIAAMANVLVPPSKREGFQRVVVQRNRG
ncbi:MAG: AAA family ATPase [Armatimonadota bacterium]